MNPPFIISASRRTDLPAFYSEWFIHRIREGYLKVRHPFSRKEILVSLKPEDVVAIVFWTKNFEPMAKYLDELEQKGFFYLIHYTITGLGADFEPRVPEPEKSVALFHQLSGRIGKERMLWRFDPMVLTEKIGGMETIARFEKLLSKLSGSTTRIYFSFVQNYARVKRRIKTYEQSAKDKILDPDLELRFRMSRNLAEPARAAGITIYSCCQPELAGFGIEPAHCIDRQLISRLSRKNFSSKPSPTRESCGCDFSLDIGAYDTCPHLCWYCYANSHPALVRKNFSAHRFQGEFLVE